MKNKKSFLITSIIVTILIIFLIIMFVNYKIQMIEDEKLIKLWQDSGMTSITYKTPAMFFVYVDLLQNSILSVLMFLPPFIVIIPGLYKIFKIIKSGYIKYIANFRENYKSFINKEILNCYKYALIVPIIYLIFIIGCGLLTGFNLETSPNALGSSAFSISFNSPFILVLMTFVNLFLADLFYINVGLMTMMKSKNILLNNVFSYLIIIIISIILELFIGYGLAILTNNYIFANLFNFYNIWYPIDVGNIMFLSLFLLLLVIVTSIIVFKIYNNEERVISNV